MRSMNVEDGGCSWSIRNCYRTSAWLHAGRLLSSVIAGWRSVSGYTVQVFHHARRLWLKSNTAFAVRLSTNSTVDMCKFLLVAGFGEDKARLAVLSCEECGAAHSRRCRRDGLPVRSPLRKRSRVRKARAATGRMSCHGHARNERSRPADWPLPASSRGSLHKNRSGGRGQSVRPFGCETSY